MLRLDPSSLKSFDGCLFAGIYILTTDLQTGVTTAKNITLPKEAQKDEKWGQENVFNAVWVPYKNVIYLFNEVQQVPFIIKVNCRRTRRCCL